MITEIDQKLESTGAAAQLFNSHFTRAFDPLFDSLFDPLHDSPFEPLFDTCCPQATSLTPSTSN